MTNIVAFLLALILLVLSWQLSDAGYQWASGFIAAMALWIATFVPRSPPDDRQPPRRPA